MSSAYNPTIRQYSTWEIILAIKNPDESPFVLTNYTGESQIRPAYGSNTILASPVVTVVDAPNGLLSVFLAKDQTAALIPTDPKLPLPVWDVLLSKTDSSETFVAVGGRVTVLPGVTQWQI
jgi:hypothetical protein